MLETKNILKEIKEYNHIKVQNNDNYNFYWMGFTQKEKRW